MGSPIEGCPKTAGCTSKAYCAGFRRCLFNGEPFQCTGGCAITWPHYHSITVAPAGNTVQVVHYIAEDENAEVRDLDTGEVIFPATKGPLRVVEGGQP